MPSNTTVCAEAGCTRTDLKAKGLCGLHYDRQRAAVLNASKPIRILQKDQPCAVEGCERLVGPGGARGMCANHARAFYKGTLGKAPKPDPYPVAECPICHQERRLDRNHPKTRQRVCQSCYRGRVEPSERKKPGPKPKVIYGERPSCVGGHLYEEGSYKLDGQGRRICLVCLESRRKTHCPKDHPYNDENTYVTPDGRRMCRTCFRLKAQTRNLARFGLTPDSFQRLYTTQHGQCAVCLTPLPLDVRELHIDHDHACCDGPFSCGKCVRGLLCKGCNPGLGFFADDHGRRAAITGVWPRLIEP